MKCRKERDELEDHKPLLECQQNMSGRQDEQQEERDRGFLTDSPNDKADGPADVSHNVLESVIL